MSQEAPARDADPLQGRLVTCMVAFIHPFRLVDGPESAPWETTIDDVNRRSWDYVRLQELVGGVDVGLAHPYHMAVARDGAVALPPLPHLRREQAAVEFFNRSFAALLLGGVYCEAIGLDGLDFGSLIDWKYVRVRTSAPAAANRFHELIRRREASPLEAIALLRPRSVPMDDFSGAMAAGRAILDTVPELSGEFLLKGVTGIARRDWGAALANVWIVVEQITEHLWQRCNVAPARAADPIPGRADQLSDQRTWTIAARHELLHQTGVLSRATLERLSEARKARNELAHRGKHPPSAAAQASYAAATDLLSIAVPGVPIPLLGLDLADHVLSGPFERRGPRRLDPEYWMEIPKLPGEVELERLEVQLRGRRRKGGGGGAG